jgi:EF-hand domain pair
MVIPPISGTSPYTIYGGVPSTKSKTNSIPIAPDIQLESSTKVTFSNGAQAIASFAANGGLVTNVSGADALSKGLGAAGGLQAINSDIPTNGVMSKDDFEKLIAGLGGTTAQADQLFSTFDTNNDGSVTQSEFVAGLGKIQGGANTPFAQSLAKLMDSNRDGSVSSNEFIDFETDFLAAEARSSGTTQS